MKNAIIGLGMAFGAILMVLAVYGAISLGTERPAEWPWRYDGPAIEDWPWRDDEFGPTLVVCGQLDDAYVSTELGCDDLRRIKSERDEMYRRFCFWWGHAIYSDMTSEPDWQWYAKDCAAHHPHPYRLQ